MPLPPTVRLALLAVAGLVCAGCGSDPAPNRPAMKPAANAQEPPRTLIAPQGAKPLLVLKPELPAHESPHPPAQALQTSLSASAPRIVELGATGPAADAGIIRQPGAVAVQAPAAGPLAAREPPVAEGPAARPLPATEPRRSAFVPPSMPPRTASPAEAALPQLPAVPNFNEPRTPIASATRGIQAGRSYSAPSLPAPAPEQAPPPVAAIAPLAAPLPAVRPDAMRGVAQQAQVISDRGLAMAQRGMLFAGRAELTKALQLIAQSLDMQIGTNTHAAALASGLAALQEAGDFAVASERQPAVDVASVAQTHQTPLLKGQAGSFSPVVVQQQYYGFAQSQLIAATGGQPVASQVLYRLGRLQTALAAHDASPQALHGPQAIVFHQAALAVDGRNYLAANELGVLLARYGQLETARDLLVRSVSIHPQVETWHNLSVVHRRLGETELAQKADRERELLAQKSGGGATRAGEFVRWVDTRTFASAGGGDTPWPEATAVKAAATSTPGQRR